MHAHGDSRDSDAADEPSAAEEQPLAPEQMLALLADQQRSIESQVAAFVPVIMFSWGIAWLFGFGALWLVDGLQPTVSLPLPVAITIFVVLLAAAVVISIVKSVRSGRGVRGNTADTFRGTVYGCAWSVGSLAILVFGQGLAFNGMSAQLANVFYPIAFVLFAGLMYLVGAAIWHAVPMLVLGVWTIFVGLIATFFGFPNHYLVLALGGGLAFLLFSGLAVLRLRVLRRAVDPRVIASKAARHG